MCALRERAAAGSRSFILCRVGRVSDSLCGLDWELCARALDVDRVARKIIYK